VGQITFLKGGFPPKYGNALSGIINIATKNPGTEFGGAFEYQTSRFAGALGSEPDDLNEFDFLEGDVSGPIPGTGDKLRFLVAGRKQSSAARVLEFDDDVYDPSNPPTGLNTPHTRDVFPGWRAFGYDDESQIFAKLDFHITPTSKISASLIDQTRQYQRYDFDFLLTGYDAQTSPVIDTRADSLAVADSNYEDVVLGSVESDRTLFVAQYNQVLGRTYFNVNGGIFKQKRRNCNFFEGVCLGNSFSDKNFSSQFVAPGITVKHPARGSDDLYGGEEITTYVLRADVQSQVTDHHNLGLGVFADFHDLKFDEDQQLGVNELFTINLKYDAKPWDAAFYIQDVIEYDFLNLDLGFRVDVGKAGGLFFVDPLDPTNGTTAREVCENPTDFQPAEDPVTGEVVTPDPTWTLASCSDPAIRDEAAIIAYQDDFEESSTRVQFSPRLGVSFPITATTNVFMNYAVNSQNPTLNNIYQNTSIGQDPGEALPCGLRGVPLDAAENAQCGPIIFSQQFTTSFLGNPNLAIERTATYEVGLLSELGEDWALTLVLFNKDQTGLTGVGRGGIGVQDIGATHGTSSLNYYVLINEDFQTVKGIEVGLRRRLTSFWAFDVNYSYSQARTNAAPPERERQSLSDESDPTLRREIVSEIDIPHRLNTMLRFNAGEEVPDIPGGSILRNSSLALTLQAQSGLPYTPTLVFRGQGGAVGNSVNQLQRNSGRGPSAVWVNLRAQKGFRVGNLVYSAFLQVDNLFDAKNCFQPLPTTGRCDEGARDQDRRRQGNQVGEGTVSTYFDRPHLFGPRRQISFGLRVEF
jgi:outer membrane receptor protein involved in Fe transport